MTFFQELKRRNVFRVGVAYLLAAWVLLQIVDLVLDVIGAPWDLEATPNLAALITDAGLDWPPASPINFPLKDW